MSLHTPKDDLWKRSIEALRGKFSRLFFMGELRTGNDDYRHWGLERTYGEQAARAAIQDTHSSLWLSVMRSPIQELEKDSVESLQQAGTSEAQLPLDSKLVPQNTEGGTRRHHFFMVNTINLLLRSRR